MSKIVFLLAITLSFTSAFAQPPVQYVARFLTVKQHQDKDFVDVGSKMTKTTFTMNKGTILVECEECSTKTIPFIVKSKLEEDNTTPGIVILMYSMQSASGETLVIMFTFTTDGISKIGILDDSGRLLIYTSVVEMEARL